jgi:hypothetical protein
MESNPVRQQVLRRQKGGLRRSENRTLLPEGPSEVQGKMLHPSQYLWQRLLRRAFQMRRSENWTLLSVHRPGLRRQVLQGGRGVRQQSVLLCGAELRRCLLPGRSILLGRE